MGNAKILYMTAAIFIYFRYGYVLEKNGWEKDN